MSDFLNNISDALMIASLIRTHWEISASDLQLIKSCKNSQGQDLYFPGAQHAPERILGHPIKIVQHEVVRFVVEFGDGKQYHNEFTIQMLQEG